MDLEDNKFDEKDDLKSPFIINEKSKYGKKFICINCNLETNIAFGITILGRIIMTLYSFHGLFFLYNFIIQYVTIIPAILIEESSGKIILYGLLYIAFAVYTSNILVIPTFELFSFPFLNYNDPLSHIYTFKIFFENETTDENIEFKSDEIISKNNNYINIFFIIIEMLYSISYIMGLLSIITIFQDMVEIIILTCVYIYYLIIFFGYFIISIYANFNCYKFKKK